MTELPRVSQAAGVRDSRRFEDVDRKSSNEGQSRER